MRLTRRIFFLGLILAASATAEESEQAPLTLETVTQRLSAPQVLRGWYSQTRQIALLSRPLDSSGRFILSGKGLYWQQEEPFSSVLIADGERLAQRLADGPMTSIDSSDQPMVLSFSRIFLNMFRGEHADLEAHFSIRFEAHDNAWEIGLTPTSYPLSEAIDDIILRGRDHIDQITVIGNSSDGPDSTDEMTIRFSELSTSPATLTAHEIELYAW